MDTAWTPQGAGTYLGMTLARINPDLVGSARFTANSVQYRVGTRDGATIAEGTQENCIRLAKRWRSIPAGVRVSRVTAELVRRLSTLKDVRERAGKESERESLYIDTDVPAYFVDEFGCMSAQSAAAWRAEFDACFDEAWTAVFGL